MAEFVAALDLGGAGEPTALAIVERGPEPEPVCSVRHLQRFPLGTSLPRLASQVAGLWTSGAIAGGRLVLDLTGTGTAAADLFAGLSPVCVTFTAGAAVAGDDRDGWRLPRREVAGLLRVLLETRRLKVASGLDLAPLLLTELQNFTVKAPTAPDDLTAWREGTEDDLVLAVGLAGWLALRPVGWAQDPGYWARLAARDAGAAAPAYTVDGARLIVG